MDSQEISINLSKIILEVMNNKFKGNKLISYLGDSRRVTDEGFGPSLRYKQISLSGAKTNTVCVKQNECVTCGINYEI